ncbi:MAG: Uncharacterised protein [Flavobacteriaceae bacterium]|nr:MAG: Uncharacterised protein [Flavobacteriaceae bacterium]
MIAFILLLILEKIPSKKRPSIPPLKMEAYFHHASNILFTSIIINAIEIDMIQMTKVLMYKNVSFCFSVASRLK